jgi:hypothetical protein
MPIDRFLQERRIGPADRERLKQAFELALKGLHLVDRNDPICQLVAGRVIEIGLDGSRPPEDVARLAIKQLGP